MPVATVARDEAATRLLRERPANLTAFSIKTPDRAFDLDEFLDATWSDAVVILQDGDLVFERYARGVDPHAPHILMSATKAVVGLLVGTLSAAGQVDVERPVETCVPEVADGPYAGATLRHLLDMRADVVLDERQQRAYEAATGWGPAPPDQGLLAFFSSLRGPAGSHGGPFRYVSANTDLLGIALERLTGVGIPELTSTRLWRRA